MEIQKSKKLSLSDQIKKQDKNLEKLRDQLEQKIEDIEEMEDELANSLKEDTVNIKSIPEDKKMEPTEMASILSEYIGGQHK